MAKTPSTIEELIDARLNDIDLELAQGEQPLDQRPFTASWLFVMEHVEAVSDADGGRRPIKKDEPRDFICEPWFARIYARVHQWYQSRYEFPAPQRDEIQGFVVLRGSAFQLLVPTSVVTPPEEDGTIWLSFPDRVLDDEDASRWVRGIRFEAMSPNERAKATARVRELAGNLRRIRSRLYRVLSSDESAAVLAHGALSYLETASSLILAGETNRLRAYWELQMACEEAFKALLQQQVGRFEWTHALPDLFSDCVAAGLDVGDPSRIRKLLHWKQAVSARYSFGPKRALLEFFVYYRNVLEILVSATSPLRGLHTENARFNIAQAPWTRLIAS